MKIIILLFILFLSVNISFAQTGIITGKVVDKSTGEPLPGVNIKILGTDFGAATNIQGEFVVEKIKVGAYSIQASFIGYNTEIKTDVVVNSAKPIQLKFELIESVIQLQGVTVTSGYFNNIPTEVTSLSMLNYEEMRRSPGGFEDVVRALSVLPGVAQASAGRNDLVVRGGAPSENLFLVDGFVIPNINHFGSQGATGGPLSFINLDYVNEISFSTGGFSAVYGDKLSSVLSIELKEGRKDRLGGKALISAT
ncbi:MAG TPA: TonB-dependent receptor, partial [Melioribacteraceae bacterium]|nr:TonB-dependent receptor [Melioribacteraceae bacterium]